MEVPSTDEKLVKNCQDFIEVKNMLVNMKFKSRGSNHYADIVGFMFELDCQPKIQLVFLHDWDEYSKEKVLHNKMLSALEENSTVAQFIKQARQTRMLNYDGKIVYQETGYNTRWTGIHDGSDLPEGAYFYTISCPDGKTASGSVSIIR